MSRGPNNANVRQSRLLDRIALRDEAAALAPLLSEIAAKYGCAPSTVAKIAVASV